MGTTANRAYPYPESTDSPAGHTQIEALADAVDADVAGLPILQAKKSIIATEQSRNSTDWGYLGTNDKVTGLVLPTDGLIVVAFQAMWKESVAGNARAAIFLNGTDQLKIATNEAAPQAQAALTSADSDTDEYVSLFSIPQGLASLNPDTSDAYTGAVTTGQAVGTAGGWARFEIGGLEASSGYGGSGAHGGDGGVCTVFAAAGTYEVGVKFNRTSGTVTAKERKLWVWTMAFD